MPELTPSQTAGPFLHIAMDWPRANLVVPLETPGAVWIRGTVRDGDGALVTDALVETWQHDPKFAGIGRCVTDSAGEFAIHTVRPSPIPPQAPHINLSIFARGLLCRLVTRIYFADQVKLNVIDPVLNSLPHKEFVPSLLAHPTADSYRFDIRLRGDDETIFFTV